MAPVWNQWNFGHNNGTQRNMGSGRLGGSGIPTQPIPTQMMPSQNPWSPISQAPQQSSPWGQMPSMGSAGGGGWTPGPDMQQLNPLGTPAISGWGQAPSSGGGNGVGQMGSMPGNGQYQPMQQALLRLFGGGGGGNMPQWNSVSPSTQQGPLTTLPYKLSPDEAAQWRSQLGSGGSGFTPGPDMSQLQPIQQNPSFGGNSFGGTLGNLARRF